MYGKYNVYKSGMYGTVAGRDVLQGESNFSFFSSSTLMFKLFIVAWDICSTTLGWVWLQRSGIRPAWPSSPAFVNVVATTNNIFLKPNEMTDRVIWLEIAILAGCNCTYRYVRAHMPFLYWISLPLTRPTFPKSRVVFFSSFPNLQGVLHIKLRRTLLIFSKNFDKNATPLFLSMHFLTFLWFSCRIEMLACSKIPDLFYGANIV